MPDEETLDVHEAADLMRRTQDHVRRRLTVKMPAVYAAWGLAWLVGLGGMWLSVREQNPYRGPSAGSSTLLGVLLVGANLVTMATVIRATRGVRGLSEIQGRIFGLSWLVGFAALFTIEGALARHGASDVVMGILGAAGPSLVTGLIYVVGAAIWADWTMFYLGAWLAVVTSVGVWTGPVTLLLVEALAAGGGFLLTAAVLARRLRA